MHNEEEKVEEEEGEEEEEEEKEEKEGEEGEEVCKRKLNNPCAREYPREYILPERK